MKRNCYYRILKFFIGIIFTLFFQYSHSAPFKFERFSNKEGFNQNSINAIEQDKYGFIWIGTPNGLIKYDGYEFRQFNSIEKANGSISNNSVRSLFNDSNGILWIGTAEGVDVYIPWLEKFLKVPIGEPANVLHIEADQNGRIWISGWGELFRCDIIINENDISFNISDNLIKANADIWGINDFYFMGPNSALLATQNGLYKIDISSNDKSQAPSIEFVNKFVFFENIEVKTLNNVNNIFWIGTTKGLFKATFEREKINIIQEFKSIQKQKPDNSDLVILSVFEDNLANVWVGTRDNGLLRFTPEDDDFEHYAYNPKNSLGISSPQINCIYQDNFGVIWIGTAQGGINKLDLNQKPFFNYAHNPYDKTTIPGNLVNGIFEDSKGKVWVSTDASVCRSINVMNERNVSGLLFENLENQLPFSPKEIVHTIYEDKKGFIWLGTDFSIAVYNPQNNLIKKVVLDEINKETRFSRCFLISQIDEDKIIFCGNGIIVVMNPWDQIKNGKNVSLKIEAITDIYGGLVYTIKKDSKGNFWIGASNGLFKCNYNHNENRFNVEEHFSSRNDANLSISNNNVFSLHEDDEGILWIGTFGGGLNKMVLNEKANAVKIECFRKNVVLFDDAVYGIIQEDKEHLWISTDMGLCRFNTSREVSEVFDVRDGLPNNNFRQSAYFKGQSGYYYFGGLNGLTIFKPENIVLNDVLPKVIITEVSVNNKLVKIGAKLNGKVLLKKSISETKEITIGNKDKTIAFNLVVQQNATPAKNRLAYMLEGFNKEWIEEKAGKTTVTYTALPPGKYIFKVKGANGDGLWNNKQTDLRIEVLPPWYQTWWSYSGFLLIILLIVAGVSIYFIQLEKLKQSLKYEQIDKKRIDTINEGKFRFFTNISHEFRTPLALIAGPLERIIAQNTDSKQSKYLLIIQNNTKRLLNLVDQLIAFRQAEQGHLKFNLRKDTLGNFIYPAMEAFEDFAIQKNINFFYKIISPNEEVEMDVEKTERIIFNLLSNSFRYTPAHGSISIEADVILDSDRKMISLKIIDNGKGIPAEKLKLIFGRFYQIEGREENVGGTGIGLAFCKSLIELMGGTISVESEPNKRTCFTALVPAKGIEGTNLMEIEHPGKSFIKNWIQIPVIASSEISDSSTKNAEHNLSILIVDDEADVRDFLSNALGEKYSIVLAENGFEGVEKIKQKQPDLILCDVMMPEMDGFRVCEIIKTEPATYHIPIILLTAMEDTENRIKGLEFGADDYISKPFSLKHLEIRIEKLIENNRRIKEYFSKNSFIPDKEIEISVRDKEFLKNVIGAIENNLSNSDFGVEELAHEILMSPSQFYRRLKQLTGQIPNVYLRNYRLQKAAELLSGSEGLNVAEVMYQVGIESNSYFSTAFKKLHGVSPSEFSKKA